MPVLALGGDIYPGLGGDIPGNFAASSLQSLATNVTGVTVPLSGHWIPEERPDFVIDQLPNSLEISYHIVKKQVYQSQLHVLLEAPLSLKF